MAPKTRIQLEKDCSRAIKIVLGQMEELAGMPPAAAAEPYTFDERRRMVIRTLWQLLKECIAYQGEK